MKSRSIDHMMLLIGVVLMLVSSYQLLFQREFSSENKVLGQLSSALSVVKIKHAMNLGWRDAFVGNSISENELIFTNKASSAEISFADGGRLQVGESSLVKITSKGTETGVNVEKGVIRAKLDGYRPLLVEVNGEEYELKGQNAEVQINLNDQEGEIGVISGEFTVEKGGMKENLNTEASLSIKREKVQKKKIPYKLLSPSRETVFYSADKDFPVTFNWSPAEEATISLSSTPQMDGAKTLNGRPGLSLDLSPGIHYWKISSDKGDSIIGSFKVVLETPPEIVRPKDGEEVSIVTEKIERANLVLQWDGNPRLNYNVEWESEEGNESRTVQGKSTIVSVKSGDRLRWRVRIEEDNRPLAPFSEWQNLKIKRLIPPSLPYDLSPDAVEYQSYKKPNEDIEIKWKSDSVVELELLLPSGPKVTEKVKNSVYDFKATEAGEYRYRLRSVDGFGRMSEWTVWKTFSITDMSEATNQGTQRIQLKRPDQQVTFNWESEAGQETVFELATDAQFKNVIIKRDLKTNSTETVIPDTGVYYWRSRQIKADGTINVSEPVKVIIEPTPAPVKPQKLPDVEVPIEWKLVEPKQSTSLWDFIFPSAFADELKGIARLEIPASDDTKEVKIKIYRDEEMQDLVLEKTISERTLVWEGVSPGTYYWQYAITDHWGRLSPFSDLSQLTVTGKEVRLPEKAKLISPIKAQEVDPQALRFSWSDAGEVTGYSFEISDKEDFSKILYDQDTKKTKFKIDEFDGKPGLYFWRVIAQGKLNSKTVSSIGRFKIKPPVERIVIADQFVKEWKKNWRTRGSVAWTPSMDSYSFGDEKDSGKIDGNTLNGIEFKGTRFLEKWIVSGEILRQSGKVFDGQSYLFQRLFIDGGKNFTLESGSRLSVGLAFGHTTGQNYSINGTTVNSISTANVSYGPIFHSYHSLNKAMEIQTKALYFFGDVKQIEVGADLLRSWMNEYHFLGGITYAMREYSSGNGEQGSLRVSIGLGKEF